MNLMPPAHGPAREDDDSDAPPADLPEVAEAVTGRARDLHRLADVLSRAADPSGTATPSAVAALVRAHAGAVDDLAEHLLAAGAAGPAGTDDPAGSGGTRDGDAG